MQNIVKDYTHLTDTGKTIILCRIPFHLDIYGNERADPAVKSVLSVPVTNMKLLACEPCISKLFGRVTGYMGLLVQFTPQLALLNVAKICPAMIRYLLTYSELVIVVLLIYIVR